MCRWLAYSGSPIALKTLLLEPEHSLIDQSLHAQMGVYTTDARSGSLFHSTDVRTLRKLYPDSPRLEGVSEDSRLVVSEPLSDLPGVWNEVPEASCAVVQSGQDELRPFRPRR